MRTNIDLNDKLLKEAMKLSHTETKKDTVELALKNLINFLKRKQMKDLFGKIKWDGDLAQMRK